ncbi:metallophosphoesterase [Candidatus Micrarchaeota archaeon]|nr:metallophosphoesterase [Candidatus Micrarchaeota archaeon]
MKESGKPGLKNWLFLLFYFLLVVYALVYEPNNLIVTHESFDFLGGTNDTPNPVRIAFISDIHIGLQRNGWLDAVVDRVNGQEPDIVLIGGDVIESDASELERLAPLARLNATYGTFAVVGNHDYGLWGCGATNTTADKVVAKLESLGIDVLRNEHRIIGGNSGFALIGVDDEWSCYDDYRAAAAGVPDAMPKVILAHNQDSVAQDAASGPGLILAGHTHCGLVRVPFITQAVLGPGFGSVLGGRARLDDDTEAYVTCGITGGGIRFLTSPEISVIDIK